MLAELDAMTSLEGSHGFFCIETAHPQHKHGLKTGRLLMLLVKSAPCKSFCITQRCLQLVGGCICPQKNLTCMSVKEYEVLAPFFGLAAG